MFEGPTLLPSVFLTTTHKLPLENEKRTNAGNIFALPHIQGKACFQNIALFALCYTTLQRDKYAAFSERDPTFFEGM